MHQNQGRTKKVPKQEADSPSGKAPDHSSKGWERYVPVLSGYIGVDQGPNFGMSPSIKNHTSLV